MCDVDSYLPMGILLGLGTICLAWSVSYLWEKYRR